MRGKDIVPPLFRNLRRITPAYAGKSHFVTNFHLNRRDHPRVCGEKPIRAYVKIWNEGSPPRMRGKVVVEASDCSGNRITPAYAGKRKNKQKSVEFSKDHPRVCGEKRRTRTCGGIAPGSPPRMRGKGPHLSAGFGTYGITPAYAGKSAGNNCLPPVQGDHPRVCGEK